jgi:hypothetical protein
MSAASLINNFARVSDKGAFAYITRTAVVEGLRARIADPTTQNQGAASLCGPAVLFYCILKNSPELYVKYVIDLYTNGSAKIGTLNVTPSKNCRSYQPTPEKISAVDWIALASLRDSENTLSDYSSADDKRAGITMPSTLASWFRAVGYRDVRDVTNILRNKGHNEIDSCLLQLKQGREICLFVNAKLLNDPKNSGFFTFPDHWVVLTAGTVVDPRGTGDSPAAPAADVSVSITVYTWGSLRRIPPSETLLLDDFSGNFFGYVSAMSTWAI